MIKITRILMILSLINGAVFTANAQEVEDWGTDSLQCRQCISLYAEPLRQKNYEESVVHWRCVINTCPKAKESIYINGAIIYRYFIDKETDAAKKEAYIDTLVWIFERQMEYWGRNPEVLERMGNDLLRYRQSKPELAYDVLVEVVDSMKENSSCVALMRYYQSLYLMYRKKAEGIDQDKMMEEYFRVKNYFETYSANNPSDPNCKIAEEAIDGIGLPFLSCDKLVPFMEKKYNALPTDNKDERLAQMKKLLDMLNRKNCNDNELFEKIVTEVVELDPSHEGYYNLALTMMNKKRSSEANTYFKKAIELCEECEKKEDYLLGAANANLVSGIMSTAASYARQAYSINPKSGKALLVIAQAIAGSGCGETSFEKKFVFYLAVEYAQRARAVDPSVSEDANKLIGRYRAYFLTTRELFEHSVQCGQTVQVGCWINEDTKVVCE